MAPRRVSSQAGAAGARFTTHRGAYRGLDPAEGALEALGAAQARAKLVAHVGQAREALGVVARGRQDALHDGLVVDGSHRRTAHGHGHDERGHESHDQLVEVAAGHSGRKTIATRRSNETNDDATTDAIDATSYRWYVVWVGMGGYVYGTRFDLSSREMTSQQHKNKNKNKSESESERYECE